jgi:hypothetical protein
MDWGKTTPFREIIFRVAFGSYDYHTLSQLSGNSQDSRGLIVRTSVRLFVLGDTPDLVVGCPQIFALPVHNLSTGAIVIHRLGR